MGFNSSMDISFKGLQNTSISTIKGQSSTGLIKMRAFRLVTDLTNDTRGEHFNDFYKALDKAGDEYAWKYVPKDFPCEKLIFDVSKTRLDNTDFQPDALFMLNGEALSLNNDKVLPIFSFLAKAITFISKETKNPELANNAQKMNNIIQEAVIDYIG